MINKMLVGFIQDGKHSGIDKYLLGFCKVAYQNGVKLDFLTDKVTPQMNEYMNAMGYGLFPVPSLKKPLSQFLRIKKIIKKGGYDAAYFNISESFNCIGLLSAKFCSVPVRIIHSHSSGVDRHNKYVRLIRNMLHRFFKKTVSAYSTKRFACSSVAGKWMFNNDFEIIYNAVDGKRFSYDQNIREYTRKFLGLTDEKTFIHIGHFCYQKNNFFLMDVFSEILKRDKNCVLLSVGMGEDFDAVCKYAKKLGIDKRIKFLGVRDDIPALLSASDVFIFPSRFEGLSITCIEAQFSGLPCVLSDAISREVSLSSKLVFLPAQDPGKWAETALSMYSQRQPASLDKNVLKNYDIVNQQEQLKSILGV